MKQLIEAPEATTGGDRKRANHEDDRWRQKTDEVAAEHEQRRTERERRERVRFDLD
ncbi:MAG: hypothetical protein IPM29_04425 [Planctomycetes bacterium]|nr:hypothetical protein [Planctomycetota bacterium]